MAHSVLDFRSRTAFGTKCSISNILWPDSLAGLLAAAKPLSYKDLGNRLRTASPNLISAANRVIANFLSRDLTGRKSPRFAGFLQQSSAPSPSRSAPHAGSPDGFSLDLWTTGIWYGFSMLLKSRCFVAVREPYFSRFSRDTEKTSAPTGGLICAAFFAIEVRIWAINGAKPQDPFRVASKQCRPAAMPPSSI
jgi:hypothetical protein